MGTAVMGALVVALLLVKAVGLVQCFRFTSEFTEAASRHLVGASGIDVAAIASARAAARDAAVARGVEPERVRVSLLREDTTDRAYAHVVVFDLEVEGCDASVRRPVGRRLSPEEVAALTEVGVHECGSCVSGLSHRHADH
ncbi:MAG: hypothetical protein KF878_01150 [Planctomycetes bacterium]|nr:hypothetical protein [Planctomycetota bacterium]MCW8137623.1 hypothetical protein [Planctomycetota bacterium]